MIARSLSAPARRTKRSSSFRPSATSIRERCGSSTARQKIFPRFTRSVKSWTAKRSVADEARSVTSLQTAWRFPRYLTLPKGLPEKNLPLIVVPHGGPWGRDNWGYNGLRSVPCKSRLRRSAAEFPRVDGLWQEVSRRRQRSVGREDAGRHHVGRKVSRRSRHRRSEASRRSWAAATAVMRRSPA